MRGRLHPLARWLRLVLACLTLASGVSAAQIASEAHPVTVVEGRPGGKPREARSATEALVFPQPTSPVAGTWFTGFLPGPEPRTSRGPLFLLHRALLR